jgi:glycine/D-amino acid oxidase-like deaminating enzyme
VDWPDDAGADLGPGQRVVDASELTTLEPRLRQPPAWALYAPADDAVDPAGITERLVQGARDHGARVQLGTTVIALRRQHGRVVGAYQEHCPIGELLAAGEGAHLEYKSTLRTGATPAG